LTRLRRLLKGEARRPRMVLGKTPVSLDEKKSGGGEGPDQHEANETPIPDSLDGIEKFLRERLGNESPDVILRRLVIWTSPELDALLFYIEGLTSRDVINMMALRSVMLAERTTALDAGALDRENIATVISTHLVPSGQITVVRSMELAMEHVLTGEGALFVEGSPECVLFEAKGWEHRGIEEPATEKVVRGPREGFAELLRANTALIRRRLRTPDLRLDATIVGVRSKTDVVVAYVEGLTDPDLVDTVKERIDAICVDIMTDSGVLEELIEDHTYSPFPQVQYTERPDRFVAALSEGLVGILVDGSPMALMIPANLSSFFQSPEDYYERFPFGGPLRTLRYIAGVIALIFPALYVAVATFHQEMIPTKLALAIAGSHVPVPFPSLVEALLMEVALELIREAAIRMPDPISQSLGFVGALLLGDAAVSAGLVSPIMVIVVAVTGLSSLIIPHYPTGLAIRLLRFPLLFLSASLGLFGLIAGLIAIALHLGGLTSFGVPYLEPMMKPKELVRDVIWRSPEYTFQRRPEYPSPQDQIRQKAFMRTWIPEVAEKARQDGEALADSRDQSGEEENTKGRG